MQKENEVKELEELKSKVKSDYTKEELEVIVKNLISEVGANPALVGQRLKNVYMVRLKKPLKLTRLYSNYFNNYELELARLQTLYQRQKAQHQISKKDQKLKLVLKKTYTKLQKHKIKVK